MIKIIWFISILLIIIWCDNLNNSSPQNISIDIKNNYNSECNIKWNISYNSKTKVYYLPECWKYNEVKIDSMYWEKWFCSEQEAIDAWWIKSYRCP